MRLYVGNLNFTTDEAGLTAAFSEIGTVASCTIPKNPDGKSKGFGFIDMDDADAQNAIQTMNGKELDGRALTVNEARPREERPRNNFGGGYQQNRGGGFNNRGGYNNR